ncbi:MAG: bifunctional glutamate N-acetyltransferase/amino-acid acetyltransferase ArgJ [Pseudomonadota bacterium]
MKRKEKKKNADEDELLVDGFLFSAVEAAIKKPGRMDLGLIASKAPVRAAGLFTTNRVKAAPVLVSRNRLRNGIAQAILVNSGNANACTGKKGMDDAKESTRFIAQSLGIEESMVLVASTGVIGQFLPMERIKAAAPDLVRSLGPNRLVDLSRAILTTDTVEKISLRQGIIDDKPVKIVGIAKGSGMIMPQMATMLCFVVTDACITSCALKSCLKEAASLSFHRITVDGDTSTNDSVFALAGGKAGNREISIRDSEDGNAFQRLLTGVLVDLAKMIVRDGEGATKSIEVRVTGSRSTGDARKAAFAVANSSLVKTALCGEDANWGRIMAALGRSGAILDPSQVSIAVDSFPLAENGIGCGIEAEKAATEVMRRKEFVLNIDLGKGPFSFNVWTCDLSIDYIKINASYRT